MINIYLKNACFNVAINEFLVHPPLYHPPDPGAVSRGEGEYKKGEKKSSGETFNSSFTSSL